MSSPPSRLGSGLGLPGRRALGVWQAGSCAVRSALPPLGGGVVPASCLSTCYLHTTPSRFIVTRPE
eukprot:2071878-Prymnesium_polylepis.1